MKKLLQSTTIFASLALTSAIFAASASAADAPGAAPPSPSPYNWTGFYVGTIAGPAQGSYNPKTQAIPGNYYSAPADIAAIAAGGAQNVSPVGFSAGAEAGYNWQSGHWLVGIETDLSAMNLNGSVNGGPVPLAVGPPVNFFGRPDRFFVNSYANADWLYTLRPRVGFVQNNWLFYATGGLALTSLHGDFTYTDGNTASDAANIQQSARANTLSTGYAVGAGVEVGLTDRLSAKAEYLHVSFPDAVASQTFIVFATPSPNQSFRQSIDLHAGFLRFGLNYRFGGPDLPSGDSPILPFKALPFKATSPAYSDWEVDVGTRTWFSTGKYGAPQPLIPTTALFGTVLASRIIFSNLNALSGEVFGRVDHASGFFVKGYLGAGAIGSGGSNDEDFPANVVYSNATGSDSGHIGYATIDAGYSFLRAPGARVGAFIGYNYYAQDINDYGCTQLAGDSGLCTNAFNNFPGLTSNNAFNSVRVGLSSEMMLTDRLKLTGDVAYLPRVTFSGVDAHDLRELLGPEASNSGSGVMLEAILNYGVTEHWNVGVGGRYWAWNMNTGTEGFNFLGSPAINTVSQARFNAERYGVFLQSSYRWGDTASPANGTVMPVKAQAVAPTDWHGFYIGGHLGGAVSDDRWADPFGSQLDPEGTGFTDVAGFGDTTHATGPLGGVQVGYNLQAGKWVFGVQADVSASSLRGENTCYSALDGFNCQRAVTSLGSFTGRLGYAWDHSLFYAKGGAAWTNTTYDLNGNNGDPLQGSEDRAHVTQWGWTAGVGVEYALGNHWSTFLEYDHIGLPGVAVPFPTVFVTAATFFPINPIQSVSIRTNIDMIKMGVNYRFNFDGLITAKN